MGQRQPHQLPGAQLPHGQHFPGRVDAAAGVPQGAPAVFPLGHLPQALVQDHGGVAAVLGSGDAALPAHPAPPDTRKEPGHRCIDQQKQAYEDDHKGQDIQSRHTDPACQQ